MGYIKTNNWLDLAEILTDLKSFNNYIHSTEDKPNQTSSFFRNNWFLGLNSISLQHLPRTTLFKLICRVYRVNRFSKHRRGTTRACMEFPGLYGIYRLALSQSNFLRMSWWYNKQIYWFNADIFIQYKFCIFDNPGPSATKSHDVCVFRWETQAVKVDFHLSCRDL